MLTTQDTTPLLMELILKRHLNYQVLKKNGERWEGNYYNGFFNDEFIGNGLEPHWTPAEGLWSAYGNRLYQGRQDHSNTNLHAYVMQRGYNSYLYHWWGKIGGEGVEFLGYL